MRRIISILLAIAMVLSMWPGMIANANPTDLPSDWAMPTDGSYEMVSQVKKLHVTYDGTTDQTIELTLNYQSTVQPINIHYVDLRLDPRLVEHIESIEGKSKQYFGFETNVNFQPMDTATYKDVPYYKNVYRVRLGGADGLFTGIPWGAEVYEAKIILHLNKKVSELPQDNNFTIESRGIGTTDDKIGSPVKYIDVNTMNSTTFVKLSDEVPTSDGKSWLKNNSTATVEYESGGTLTTESSVSNNRQEVEFGQGVMRIKYYIYPKMLLGDSYNALIDQYKHYSLAVDLEDKLIDLIPEGAKIRVNAVRRVGSAYNHLEVPASDYIVREPGKTGGELRLSVYGPESRTNPDKTKPTDPLINNHNMYIPADANGSMPAYVQIEIPIDETKAADNFDYNKYHVQMYYYNKIGRLVNNSLVRSFTNGAKTANPPSILNGKALLYGDSLKGTGAQVGSTIYVVSATDDPANFTSGGLLKPGVGKLIAKGTVTNDDLTFKVNNPKGQDGKLLKFAEITNEATGENFKEGEKVYVFQAIPGRMMSQGQTVVLEATQTQTPIIDPVTGNQQLDNQMFNAITGRVPKNDPTSDLTVTVRVYRGGQMVNGKRDGGTLLQYKTGSLSSYQSLVYGPVKASTFDKEFSNPGYVEQKGGDPLLVVSRDGTYSVYHNNSMGVRPENNGNIQAGDIIEVVATEENNKESEIAYHLVGLEANDSTATPPNVAPVHPTVAANGKDGEQGNDPNEAYDNKPLEIIKIQTSGKLQQKYKIEIKRPSGDTEELIWTSGTSNKVSAGWHDVKLPAEVHLLPGDIVYVSQAAGRLLDSSWTEFSDPKKVIVTPDPDEYYYYEFEIYLEGKGDKPVEVIKVHRNKQAYPEGSINYPLPSVRASNPQIATPQTLINYLTTDGIAKSYIYNREDSTEFSVRPTKDFEAYWAKLAEGLQNANIAAHAGNKYKLVFGKDPRFWGDLLFNAGAQGSYNPEDFAKNNSELIVTDDSVKYTGIKFNETTWANVKTATGLTDLNIIPKANPGYKFKNFTDEQNHFVTLNDGIAFNSPTQYTAQYEIDENQFFGYEIKYVYNAGTEDAPDMQPIPGKEAVKGQAPLEKVVPINSDPVDGFAVKADQPKELKVQYIREEQNGAVVDNQVLNGVEPKVRQVIEVVYERTVSEIPVIKTEPVMDTTELVEGTSAPYAGIKLYYAKNTAAAGEPERWVADTEKPLLGETTTNKDGIWKVPVKDLIVGEKIVALAKDPLKGEINSLPKEVVADTNKFTGTIVINPVPKTGEEVVEGQITLNDNPNKPDNKADLIKGTIVEIFTKGPGPEFALTKVGTAVADKNGKFYAGIRPEELTAGKTLVAKAKPRKSVELETEAVVAVNPDRLNKAIADGNKLVGDETKLAEALKKYPKADVDELKKLVEAGKALVDTDGNPKPEATQLAADNAAKAIEDKLRNMGVITAPTIEASNKRVTVGSAFKALDGVTVTDSQGEEIIPTVESIVKVVETTETPVAEADLTKELGSYKITYKAVNAAGKESTKTISVEVVEADKGDLKVAIANGNAKLNDGKEYNPEKKAALDKAISDGKLVLENKNAPQGKVDEATKAINDAIAALGDQVQTATPKIAEKVKNGINKVVGTAEPGAFVYIKDSKNNIIGTTIADNTGKFEALTSRPLVEKEVLTVTAQANGKTQSAPATTTVVPNTDELTKTIGKADEYIEGLKPETLDPADPIDKELDDALTNAKDIKAKAEAEPPTATQKDVDDANDRLNKALDTKKAKDAVEKAKENPTDENIKDAQDKIDKLPGNTDPTSPDYNKDKDDLQKELDKINKTPAPERVDQPLNKATTVTGKARPGSTVVVTLPKDGGKYEAVADPTTGEFTVKTRPLTGGEKLEVTAKDGNKAVSDPVEATVVTDVAKLKVAIKKGETAAKGLDPNTTDPEDKELLDAIAAGKDILVNPLDPNSPAKPDKTQKEADDAADRILAAIKAKEEADENDANAAQTAKPSINEPIQNKAETVSGTAVPGSKVVVKIGETGPSYETTTNTEGNYSVTTRPLVGGEVITVTAKDGVKPVSEAVKATVVTDVKDLKAAIGEGETAMEKANTPPTAEDEALQAAIDAGKALIVDPVAEPPVAKENVTQKQADDSAQKIREAIKAKQTKDAENLTVAEKEAKRQDLITKLKDAIKRGEDFQAEPGYENILPEDKAVLEKALAEAKKDLVDLEKPDWNFVPDEAKVDKDIKDIDDAIANARKVSKAPEVDPIKHNTNIISGQKGNPGDTITVTLPDGFTKDVVVEANGTWSVTSPKPLISGEVVKAQVTKSANPKLGPSDVTSVTVGLDTTGLQQSYDKADPIVNNIDKPLDANSNTDKALKEAFEEADRVLKDAATDNPTVTQDEVDAAKKALDDALAEKTKFEDAKTAVDNAKANPSKETIADAQAKIDAMQEGDDKAKLQKELDKIKLQEAINEADKKLEDTTLDPTDKKAIEDAKIVAEKDLKDLNDGNPATDPTHDKINTDIKNLEDAINGAKSQTDAPGIAALKKGDNIIKGTAEVGATVIVKVNDVEIGTVVATDGNYSLTVTTPLADKDIVKAVAQAPGKTPSNEVQAVVGVYKGDLEQAIIDGNQALIDNPNTPPTNADNKLQEAINNGETVKNDPNATQEQVDKATQKIKEAIDQKAAEDAVKALEEKQAANDPLNPITPEEIQDAQNKIDKLPGSIADPLAPDYNADKKDLQDRLDKVKAIEDLKDVVEKGKEAVEKAKEEGKPASVIENTEKVIKEAEEIINNNGEGKTTEAIKTEIEIVEEAIKDLSKPFVMTSIIGGLKNGNRSIVIRTNPGNTNVNIVIKRDGLDVKNFDFATPGTGIYNLSLEGELKAGDLIEITADAPDYLETKSTKFIE